MTLGLVAWKEAICKSERFAEAKRSFSQNSLLTSTYACRPPCKPHRFEAFKAGFGPKAAGTETAISHETVAHFSLPDPQEVTRPQILQNHRFLQVKLALRLEILVFLDRFERPRKMFFGVAKPLLGPSA